MVLLWFSYGFHPLPRSLVGVPTFFHVFSYVVLIWRCMFFVRFPCGSNFLPQQFLSLSVVSYVFVRLSYDSDSFLSLVRSFPGSSRMVFLWFCMVVIVPPSLVNRFSGYVRKVSLWFCNEFYSFNRPLRWFFVFLVVFAWFSMVFVWL